MAAANDLQKWMDKKFKSQPEVQSQFEINRMYGIQRLSLEHSILLIRLIMNENFPFYV